MPRYFIIPSDKSCATVEISESNPGRVLLKVQALACKAADVERDGEYCFSVRLDENGLWTIYQRSGIERGEVVPAYG